MNTLRGHEAQVETVRVGVLSTVESLVVPEVIRRLHRRHGALVVSVATGPSAYLLAQLKVGELDLVVGADDRAPVQRVDGGGASRPCCSPRLPSATCSGPAEFPWCCRWRATSRQHADSLMFVQVGHRFAG